MSFSSLTSTYSTSLCARQSSKESSRLWWQRRGFLEAYLSRDPVDKWSGDDRCAWNQRKLEQPLKCHPSKFHEGRRPGRHDAEPWTDQLNWRHCQSTRQGHHSTGPGNDRQFWFARKPFNAQHVKTTPQNGRLFLVSGDVRQQGQILFTKPQASPSRGCLRTQHSPPGGLEGNAKSGHFIRLFELTGNSGHHTEGGNVSQSGEDWVILARSIWNAWHSNFQLRCLRSSPLAWSGDVCRANSQAASNSCARWDGRGPCHGPFQIAPLNRWINLQRKQRHPPASRDAYSRRVIAVIHFTQPGERLERRAINPKQWAFGSKFNGWTGRGRTKSKVHGHRQSGLRVANFYLTGNL